MALRLCQEDEYLLAPRSSAIRAFALGVWSIFSSLSTAAEFEELSVTEAYGEYRLRIAALLDAPADYVHIVITDYKHAYRINPSVTKVEILPSHNDKVVRVRNQSEQWVGPFCFNIDWVGDILETVDGDIRVKTLPEPGNFESGTAIWKIRPHGERTRVLHESRLKPDFFIPPVIGDNIMKNMMRTSTLDTFKRIECHARAMFERDMENATELLMELSAAGRDCIHPEALAEIMPRQSDD
jgi:hypothetical protein